MESIVHLGDGEEALRGYRDLEFDVAIVDPPYGIGEDGSKAGGRVSNLRGGRYVRSYEGYVGGDVCGPAAWYYDELLRVSRDVIIWGGNHLCGEIGRGGSCWIVWDKRNGGGDFSDCELAWTNLGGGVRIFRYLWSGMLHEENREHETRIHPTQKPVALYEWILRRWGILRGWGRMLDTHVGSGSSRIAAWRMGIDYVGWELDGHYWGLQEGRFRKEAMDGQRYIY